MQPGKCVCSKHEAAAKKQTNKQKDKEKGTKAVSDQNVVDLVVFLFILS